MISSHNLDIVARGSWYEQDHLPSILLNIYVRLRLYSNYPATMDEDERKSPKELVERYYYDGWNKADADVVRSCLHPDVKFYANTGRGKKHGAEGVVQHMHAVHGALGRHTKQIEDIVATGDRVAVRVKCTGVHSSKFFGVDATGHEVTWHNAVFFTIRDGLITRIWVLSDTDGIKAQIGANQGAAPFSR